MGPRCRFFLTVIFLNRNLKAYWFKNFLKCFQKTWLSIGASGGRTIPLPKCVKTPVSFMNCWDWASKEADHQCPCAFLPCGLVLCSAPISLVGYHGMAGLEEEQSCAQLSLQPQTGAPYPQGNSCHSLNGQTAGNSPESSKYDWYSTW
jgi:hypothetical protein